jgi:O-antigen ligase
MTSALRDARRLVPLGPALIVVVTALIVQPQQAGGFRLTKWSAFGFGLAALSVALGWLAPPKPFRLPRAWLVVGAFVAAAAVLPAFSSSLAPTHWPNALLLLSGLAMFFVTAMALEDSEQTRQQSLVVLVAGGVLCASIVLLQVAGLRWFTSDVYTGLEFQAPGTFGNPNWAAAFLAPLVPLALGLGSYAKRRWLYYVAAAFLAFATLATLSKNGAVTLGAGLFVFLVLGHRVPRRRRLVLLAAAAVIGAVVLVLAWRHQDALLQASWLRGRLFLWKAALVIADQHSLTGVGLGAYPVAYGPAAAALIQGDPAAFMPLATVDFAHNDLLQFAAEGGFLTSGAFVYIVGVGLMTAHQRGDLLSRAVGGALAALVVNGWADSPLRVPSTFVLFFFLFGWLVPTRAPEKPNRLLHVAIALLGLVQGVRFAAGNHYWTEGRSALADGKPGVAPLEQARSWLPEHGRSASQYARALGRAGRFDEALAASNVAASLRFDFDDEIFRRDLQSRSLDRAAAIREWRELSARFPSLVTPQLRLGALYLRTNDREAAIDAYEAVVANPQDTKRAEAARVQARSLLQSLLNRPRRSRD